MHPRRAYRRSAGFGEEYVPGNCSLSRWTAFRPAAAQGRDTLHKSRAFISAFSEDCGWFVAPKGQNSTQLSKMARLSHWPRPWQRRQERASGGSSTSRRSNSGWRHGQIWLSPTFLGNGCVAAWQLESGVGCTAESSGSAAVNPLSTSAKWLHCSRPGTEQCSPTSARQEGFYLTFPKLTRCSSPFPSRARQRSQGR